MKKTITLFSLLILLLYSSFVNAQEAYLGDIKLTAVNFDQRGWMSCDGRLLPISQYQALFSLLGTNYGGDGRTTFGLPDLRSRVPVGVGSGPGLTTRTLGQKGGSETNTLTISNLPSHNHSINAVSAAGNQSSPTNNLLGDAGVFDKEYSDGSTDTTMNSTMVGNTGGGQSINNMQPYTVVRYVICVQGLFPSRN